jgi:hypothetical protein
MRDESTRALEKHAGCLKDAEGSGDRSMQVSGQMRLRPTLGLTVPRDSHSTRLGRGRQVGSADAAEPVSSSPPATPTEIWLSHDRERDLSPAPEILNRSADLCRLSQRLPLALSACARALRRILIRWDKKVRHYLGFLHLACASITYKQSGLLG